jgi:hypothetical protein
MSIPFAYAAMDVKILMGRNIKKCYIFIEAIGSTIRVTVRTWV